MFVRRVWFTNDDRRELKETIELLKFLNLRITFGVSEKRLRGVNTVKSRNSKQQIHRKHFLLKNKDNKHVNGKKNVKMSSNNTKSGSSECTVILSVMYHSNLSNRSSDIRDLLIAGFIKRVSFVNNGWREQKETPSSN
ncbi:hypothetical protein T01_6189 [Trichinella spiralis]|uniref:Uncharacterized protein n=1 Tax=Trichinella spiralis TaxID=6334 RepID=A0A0V1AK87_TRISP|nr:hypothetical protein T01_6189 [Trichinella spiralis]